MELIFHSLLGFLGGLGIFLYGAHLLSGGLQKIAASKMREYLTRLTSTRPKGVFSGIAVTFLLQSSTVTSILVVGLVGSSAITLSQAFGVVIGSAIGTTLTVQILTFNIAIYSSVFIFSGAICMIFINRELWKTIGLLLLSIGFIFFGIHLITTSLEPISEQTYFYELLTSVADNPILFALIAMVLTGLFHSSAAMIIIGIALVSTDVLTPGAIIPLVLGANVGSTLPVIISSLSSNMEGKKVAYFYFAFKFTGVFVFLLCLPWINELLHLLPGDGPRQIANFHTMFNVVIAVFSFPFLSFVARVFEKIFPKEEEATFTVRLNKNLLEVPEEALIHTKGQINRLANMVNERMIGKLKNYMQGTYSAQHLAEVENQIDASYIEIQQFLLHLGQRDLSKEQSIFEVKLLNILNEIEHIGDTVIRFVGGTEKSLEKDISFNEHDIAQIDALLGKIERTYESSFYAFEHHDRDLAKATIQSNSMIEQFEKDIKFAHYNELITKREYNPEISALYLDIVNHLMQINHHAMNISRTVLGLI